MSLDAKATIDDVEIAFKLLLDRPVGTEGRYHYQRHAVDAGWTLAMLRDAIIGSPEYRSQRLRSVAFNGFNLFVDPTEPDFGRHIATYNGQYEEHNLVLLRAMLRPGDTFVDVGANVGLLSLTARTAVGATGKVICFEPMASNAALLVQSIIFNDFNNMVVYPIALSDEVRSLYLQGSSNGKLVTAGSLDRKITTVIGDSVLEKEDRVDVLKMDIEGHEPLAMRGLTNTLRKHRPMIMCEYNPTMLRANSNSDPATFSDQVFAMTNEVQVIDYDGGIMVVHDTAALLHLWDVKNEFYTRQGRITRGYLHFDLLFRSMPL